MSERINTPFTNEHFVAFCEKMVSRCIRATGCCLFFRMVIPKNASGKIIPARTAGARKSVRKPRRKPESSTKNERSRNNERSQSL